MLDQANAAPAQARYAEVNGAQISYEVAGSGRPLVLVHAGVADSRMWDPQFHLFAERYAVIRYDLRGFGKTMMPAGKFASHADLAGLLRFLGVGQAYVVGVSFGGKIAIDFALAYPEMVGALVLGAPNVGGHRAPEEVRRFGEEEEAALERGDLAAATELNLRMWVDGPRRTPDQVDPVVRERVREMQYHAFTIPIPEDVEELQLTPSAITRLSEITAPTLILVGDHDIADKLTLADRLAAEISGAQKVVIRNVAHMVNMEAPELFNQLVLDFLDTVE